MATPRSPRRSSFSVLTAAGVGSPVPINGGRRYRRRVQFAASTVGLGPGHAFAPKPNLEALPGDLPEYQYTVVRALSQISQTYCTSRAEKRAIMVPVGAYKSPYSTWIPSRVVNICLLV